MAQLAETLVKTVDGLVRGRIAQSIRGLPYLSFQGIPYAQPPVGELRFKPPKQVKPWSGELKALKEGPTSPSFQMGTTQYIEGSNEDCLYLNVYTNKIPAIGENLKRPVLVWIHGGGFFVGSGDTDIYGPDHLILKDIVLVTINYRLGALGFLSLQNDECPGNNGLRDQVESLRWVQRNIHAFGGDAKNVTIFGESAGGASVQFLMISDQAQGLYQKAISQSGSVLCPWALTEDPLASAFTLGEVLGKTTKSKDELFQFLKTVPARTIVEASHNILRKVKPEYYYISNAFGPCVEAPSPNAFLSEEPEKLIKEAKLHDVPYIVGVNTLEGLIMASKGLKPMNTKQEFERLLPIHPYLKPGTAKADSILEKIKSFYFPGGYNDKGCCDVLSSIYFTYPNDVVLKALTGAAGRKSKTFFYQYSYDGTLNYLKQLMGYQDWKGTLHAEDVSALFYSYMMKPEVKSGSVDETVINTMCQLWSDFAATGNPTPKTQLWEPYDNVKKVYLEINDTLKPGRGLNESELSFWLSIYSSIAEISPKL